MQSHESFEQPGETPSPSSAAETSRALRPDSPAATLLNTAPRFDTLPKSIIDLVAHPDFPQNALGEHVDIGGYTGVIVGIVKHSIKVRSAEGGTVSYNINTLRKLYGPHLPEPEPPVAIPAPPAAAPAPQREVILEPNFNAPLRDIAELVQRPDFPKCAFGELVDLHGYTGVVIEIVNRSLKVRSREGVTRSYNADGLRRLYGKSGHRPGA